jgi:hypothetical protein
MEHRIRWFGILPGTEPLDERKVPRNRHMNGRDWGWDVECSCGWKTTTGGAIQQRIKEEIEWHRRFDRPYGSHPYIEAMKDRAPRP